MQYSDIKPYIEAGLTDEEIADALRLSGVTPRKVPISDLLFELNNRAMLVRLIRPADTGEKWAGTVVNMMLYITENGTPEQVMEINQWFSHITNDRNQSYDTTIAQYAAPLWSLRNQFGGQPTMPTVEDFDAIAAIGGGWKFADVTAEDVAECKAAKEKEGAFQPLPTDTVEKQILVSINASPGKFLATATITELTMRDGKVVQQLKPEVLINGTLIDLVTPVIEALRNG